MTLSRVKEWKSKSSPVMLHKWVSHWMPFQKLPVMSHIIWADNFFFWGGGTKYIQTKFMFSEKMLRTVEPDFFSPQIIKGQDIFLTKIWGKEFFSTKPHPL